MQSELRLSADLKQLDKRIAQAKTKNIKALKELGTHPGACEVDAVDAANALALKLKYHRLTDIEIQLKPHIISSVKEPAEYMFDVRKVG